MNLRCPLCGELGSLRGYGEGERRCACGWDSAFEARSGVSDRASALGAAWGALDALEHARAALSEAEAAAGRDRWGLAHRDQKRPSLARARAALAGAATLRPELGALAALAREPADAEDPVQRAPWHPLLRWGAKGRVLASIVADRGRVEAAREALRASTLEAAAALRASLLG